MEPPIGGFVVWERFEHVEEAVRDLSRYRSGRLGAAVGVGSGGPGQLTVLRIIYQDHRKVYGACGFGKNWWN